MCDMGMILSIAAGTAQAAGQASAASKNNEMIREEAQMQHVANARELLVETNAANKDAYQAKLEGDRVKSTVIAQGEGLGGPTAGLRAAEQSRQTSLSIANAKDRAAAAQANYALSGDQIEASARNRINVNKVSPMTAFTNIAQSGIDGYGKFRRS